MSIRRASMLIAVVVWALMDVSAAAYAQVSRADSRDSRRQAVPSRDSYTPKAPNHQSRWAPSRRPQPDISTTQVFEYRDYSMFDWRRYDRRPQWSRDRFPRFFNDLRVFDRRHYHGETFGPHYRLWYRYAGVWISFYWPYAVEPHSGCSTYFVPSRRGLYTDMVSGIDYWDYTDYRRLYICFD